MQHANQRVMEIFEEQTIGPDHYVNSSGWKMVIIAPLQHFIPYAGIVR
jgi:hypothetical protein